MPEDDAACSAKRNFETVKRAIEAKLIGNPVPSVSEEDIDTIVAEYRKQLLEDTRVGNQMVARFNKWELAIEKTLEDILNDLPDTENSNKSTTRLR